MSEQKVYPKIENDILELFDGELQENALKFVAYLNANQLTPKQDGPGDWKIPYKEFHLCMIQIESNKWTFTFFFGDYSGEFDEGFITTVQGHVNICESCHDGCTGGIDKTIFGKEYINTCSQLTIQFENPNEKTLEYIKTLIECSKEIAPHSESWHAHN